MEKNKVEVYSLNPIALELVQWTLQNNFVDFTYTPTQILTPSLPSLDHSDYVIIIQTPISDDVSEEEYTHFYNTPQRESWDTKKYITIKYEEAQRWYGHFLLMIQLKFNIEVRDEWEYPTQIE
jgi:hypothetical protein